MDNRYIDDRERQRANRARIRRLEKKRRLRRLLILGMAVILAFLIMGGCAIRNAIVSHKAQETAAVKAEEAKKAKQSQKPKEMTIQEQIKVVQKQAKKEGCPDEIIGLMDNNPEVMDFVKDYKEKKDNPASDTIGDSLVPGQIPKLLQWDERWGYASYGTSTIAASGCGPTCMAMVISGLTQDASVTPYRMAQYSEENSYLDETNNTYWIFMNQAAENWGISSWETMLDETRVAQELNEGHPIICSVGPGDFTTAGHFIVLTGYADGRVNVNDPFSRENSEKDWVYADIADQIKEMWVYSY